MQHEDDQGYTINTARAWEMTGMVQVRSYFTYKYVNNFNFHNSTLLIYSNTLGDPIKRTKTIKRASRNPRPKANTVLNEFFSVELRLISFSSKACNAFETSCSSVLDFCLILNCWDNVFCIKFLQHTY